MFYDSPERMTMQISSAMYEKSKYELKAEPAAINKFLYIEL